MATITEQKLIDNNKRALIKYTFVFDGTELANTRIVDASNLKFSLNSTGKIATSNTNLRNYYKTDVKRIFGLGSFQTAGGYADIKWNGTNTATIVLVGDAPFDFDFQSMGDGAVISNPDATSNGDILISTNNTDSGDTLTLFIDLRKDSSSYDAGQTADPTAFNSVGIKP